VIKGNSITNNGHLDEGLGFSLRTPVEVRAPMATWSKETTSRAIRKLGARTATPQDALIDDAAARIPEVGRVARRARHDVIFPCSQRPDDD
jgi:hypothetical protein